MRRFTDETGRSWDVMVSRTSWGALYALFVPAGVRDPEPPRQALLRAEGYAAAQAELEGMDDAALAELFRRAETTDD